MVSSLTLQLSCVSATGLRKVTFSKGLCVDVSSKTEQVASTDTSDAQRHSTCRNVQRKPLPGGGGYSLLGRRAAMSLSKLMSQEYIILC